MTPRPSSLRSDLRRAFRLLVVPAFGLVFVVLLLPGRTGLAIRIFALVVCAVGLLLLVAGLRRSFPQATPLRPRVRRTRPQRDTPETLDRLETRAALAIAGAFDLHYRLRPVLRELADGLLGTRHNISLEAQPERSRSRLGEDAWELIREDRPPPSDRLARGMPVPELARIVEALEDA